MLTSASSARVLVAAFIAAQASIGLTLPARARAASNDANCGAFIAEVIISGQPQQAVGQTCQQQDGRWLITQSTPGQPPPLYTLPPAVIYAAPYPAPYCWADPWVYAPGFFIGGTAFFADRFHRFHHGGAFERRFGHRGFSGRGPRRAPLTMPSFRPD